MGPTQLTAVDISEEVVVPKPSRWSRTWPILVATGVVGLPLIVAVISLAGRRWFPVLDLAMTELRIRDVGSRYTPLIGLPGRIGTFPDQGSHPGPLSFWLLAPGYRVFGSSAWAMEVATVSLQLAWISVALWIGQRRLGHLGLATVAALLAILIRGYGLTVLVQPWNPYLPLLAWAVVLLALWSVLVGDHMMIVPLTIAATFAAQTHIPYLVMAGSLGVVAVVVVAVRAWRAQDRRPFVAPLVWSAGLFAVLWIGAAVDQVRHDPGNIRRLIDYFTTPTEDTVGLVGGIELLLRHLDIVQAYGGLLTGTGSFIEASSDPNGAIWPGVLVLAGWVGCGIVAVRLAGDRPLRSPLVLLHLTVLVTLACSLVSMMRIFGKIWYYLTLWAWGTTTLLFVAMAWTVISWFRARNGAGVPDRRAVLVAAGVIAAACTAATVAVAPDTDHPEERLGETFGVLVDPTVEAILDGVGESIGPDGRYVVTWTDAYFFGSQGYGMVNELERAGLDVGVYDTWRVPVTPQRVVPIEEIDAEVVLATGQFVERWRADPRVVEVAAVDPKSPDEQAEYARLRRELIDDLRRSGLDDLVPVVDANLFGVQLDPRVSAADGERVDRMLFLGQETAVFIGPAGVNR
jgi:hypothetical protein